MLAFSNIKTKLGGRVRLILSGAAPLAKPAQEFLSCCMCAPVLQGYGLTETCAASSIAEPFRWDTIGTVGAPMPGACSAGAVDQLLTLPLSWQSVSATWLPRTTLSVFCLFTAQVFLSLLLCIRADVCCRR
jgi:acyl-CoA synthetase (AMP-forming)/AMP-acid ligase II